MTLSAPPFSQSLGLCSRQMDKGKDETGDNLAIQARNLSVSSGGTERKADSKYALKIKHKASLIQIKGCICTQWDSSEGQSTCHANLMTHIQSLELRKGRKREWISERCPLTSTRKLCTCAPPSRTWWQ